MDMTLFNKLRKIPIDAGPCRISDERYKYLCEVKYKRDLTRQEIADHVSWQFYAYFGYNLDLEQPCTFNEKLNWLKVYYHNPLMRKCADKATFNDFVMERLPEMESHLVPKSAILHSPWEITESMVQSMPEHFVMKSNFGSGAQRFVVREEANLDKMRLDTAMWMDPRLNHYYFALEYGYKNLPPAVVIEPVVEFDCKIEFFCFDGEPFIYWVLLNDKTSDMRANLYTMSGEKLDTTWNLKNFHRPFIRPPYFDELAGAARVLSAGFPHVRVDFFAARDTWYFSELTFFKGAAYTQFSRYEMDVLLGKKVPLRKMG